MTSRIPSLAALRALSATSQFGSFSAAADHLGVTQGAIAQQVRQLEAQIGFKLFERWARGLRPTNQCKHYLAQIEPPLQTIAEATEQLVQSPQETTRHVVISTTPSIASRWLIPRLGAFYLEHSDIVIAIDATEKLRRFTGSDAADIALRWGGKPNSDLRHEQILSNSLIAVASPAIMKSKGLSLDRLKSATLINDGHLFWDSWSSKFDIELPSKPLDFGQTNHAIDAAINGLGIALVPLMLVNDIMSANKLIRVLPKQYDLETHLQFHLITKIDERRKPVQTVRQWISDQAEI